MRDLDAIREAVATYCTRAAEKLRAQQSACTQIRISIRTGMFNAEDAKYASGVLCQLSYPTDDTRLLIQAASEALNKAYRDGYAYSKAEVLLLGLCQRNEHTLICSPLNNRQRLIG